jgi:hypothetical protein
MNSSNHIPNANGTGFNLSADAALKDLDATLNMLAKAPAPAGMEDRVFAGVLASPRKARVLEWPQPLYAREWVRGVAAAVLVLAVGGGGWGIYAHVQQNQPAKVVVAPRPVFQTGGFSSAEMIRRPQTLNGPEVKKAEPAKEAKANRIERTAAKKPARTITKHDQHAVKAQPGHTGSGVTR